MTRNEKLSFVAGVACTVALEALVLFVWVWRQWAHLH